MTERTTTVDVAGQTLFLHEWGEPDARVALFLHGAGDDGRQAAALAAAVAVDYQVVAPDLPGHGRSPRGDPESYRPSRLASLVIALLDELGVASAALIGFSWGDDLPTAMTRGLVEEPIAPTYAALGNSALPVLLVTALRDEALAQLRVDPLRRLRREGPQAGVARGAGP